MFILHENYQFPKNLDNSPISERDVLKVQADVIIKLAILNRSYDSRIGIWQDNSYKQQKTI